MLFAALEATFHHLPLDDRLRVARPLLAPSAAGDRGGGDGPVAEAVDWALLGERLAAAEDLLPAVRDILARRDTGIEVGELDEALERVHRQIEEAHRTCRQARQLGLDSPAGTGLATVRDAIAARRAELVDAQLARRRRTPRERVLTWTVDYRASGGFFARPAPADGDHRMPQDLRGSASTPAAAADVLAEFCTGEAAVEVVFDPPLTGPVLLACLGIEADTTDGFRGIEPVLAARGACYEELLDACAGVRERLRGSDIPAVLAERAAYLNRVDPPVQADPYLAYASDDRQGGHRATLRGACWVAPRLFTPTRAWNAFGEHRPEVPGEIAAALAGEVELAAFIAKLHSGRPVNLLRVPAWCGPLYVLGSNGQHRLHTARMLELPWLCATVTSRSIPTEFDVDALCGNDVGEDRPARHREHRAVREQRIALLEGLLRRGIIDGDLTVEGSRRGLGRTAVLNCRSLPAPWLLRNPGHTTAVNAAYERRYPGALAALGVPEEVGTDPQRWVAWLTS